MIRVSEKDHEAICTHEMLMAALGEMFSFWIASAIANEYYLINSSCHFMYSLIYV